MMCLPRPAQPDPRKGAGLRALRGPPTMTFQTCFPWAFDAPTPRSPIALYRCRNGRMARAAAR